MNPQSIIPQSDDRLLSYFLMESLKSVFDVGDKNEKDKREGMLIFILLGLIAIVSTEPLKVLLRKNIGKLSLSFPRLAVACLLYLAWAWLLFYLHDDPQFEDYKTPLLAGVVFYGLFAFVVLVLGVIEYFKGLTNYKKAPDQILLHLYRGDSVFLGYLLNKGKQREKIWMIFEPFTCFLLGLIITVAPMFLHPILGTIGAPILVTSLSFWFNEWFQISNVWDVQVHKIMKERNKQTQKQQNNLNEEFFTINSN